MSASFIASDSLAKTSSRMDTRALAAIHVALFALLSVAYWTTAASVAAVRSLWMDEVLAVWTARFPTIGAIWDALMRGADYSPPLYHIILHHIIEFSGNSALMLRLPSLIGTYAVGIAAFVLVRRRYTTPIALLAMALCLTSCLYLFAIQARPYALVVACFALAVLAWDTPPDAPPSWRRAAAIVFFLTLAIGMHFYAVLLAAALGLMELIRTLTLRRIRWLFIGAIGAACLSILLWLPLMQAIAGFNSGDVAVSEFYARPQIKLLPLIYGYVLVGHEASVVLSPLTALVVAGIISLVLRGKGNASAANPARIDNLDILIWVASAIPVLIFAFSYFVTQTYNVRYVIAATLGLTILTAQLIARMRWATASAYSLVAIAIGVSFYAVTTVPLASATDRAIALAEHAPADLKIATGHGLVFFELREGANAATAGRLVYVRSPDGSAPPDRTNERAIERWAILDPSLVVTDVESFVRANPRFLLFSDSRGVDILPAQLAARGYVIDVIARDGRAYLADVQPGPAHR